MQANFFLKKIGVKRPMRVTLHSLSTLLIMSGN